MPEELTDSQIVASNTAFLFIGEIATRALSLILILALARYLGDLGLGAYSFAFAFTGLLLQFIDLGIPTYAVKELAGKKDIKEAGRAFLTSAISLRLAISLAILAATAAFYVLSPTTAETKTVLALAALGTIFNFLEEPFRSVILALEKHHYYSIITIAERLMFTALAIWLVITGHGVVAVMWAFFLGSLAGLLVTATIVTRKFASFSLRLRPGEWKALATKGLPFWISNILMTVYYRTDTVMLSAMKGFEATGWYNAAFKIVDSFTFVPYALTVALYPTMSRMFKSKPAETLKAFYKKGFYYLIITGIPMAVLLMLLSDRIIRFLYKPEFLPSVIALQILVWAEALLFINYLMGNFLNSIDKQRLFTILTGIYAALNVALNAIAIPRYGHAGAAGATLASQLLQAATLYYFCSKNGYGLNLPRMVYKPIIATAAMAAAVMLLKQAHILAIAPAAAAAYLLALVALRGLGKEDLELAKGLALRFTRQKNI